MTATEAAAPVSSATTRLRGMLVRGRYVVARRSGVFPSPWRMRWLRVAPPSLLHRLAGREAPPAPLAGETGTVDVAILIPMIELGGAELVAIYVAEALHAAGHTVAIVVTDAPTVEPLAAWRERIEAVGALFILDAPKRSERALQLLRTIDAVAPRAILNSNSSLGNDVSPALRAPGRGLIDIHHGILLRAPEVNPPTCLRMHQPEDLHICVSPQARDHLVNVYRFDPERVLLVGNGVAIPDVASARTGGPLRIGFVGRFAEVKNPQAFAAVAEAALARGLDVEFHMFGDGEHLDEIAARTEALDRLTIHGPVTDQAAIFGAIDVLLLTSRAEGHPLVVLEAMAYGVVPVVATVGAVADTIADGDNGYLLPNDEAALIETAVERIALLAAEPERQRAMAARARETAIERYDVRLMQQRYLELLLPDRQPVAAPR